MTRPDVMDVASDLHFAPPGTFGIGWTQGGLPVWTPPSVLWRGLNTPKKVPRAATVKIDRLSKLTGAGLGASERIRVRLGGWPSKSRPVLF